MSECFFADILFRVPRAIFICNTAGPLMIESPWDPKIECSSTGAFEALDDLSVVKTKLRKTGRVSVD